MEKEEDFWSREDFAHSKQNKTPQANLSSQIRIGASIGTLKIKSSVYNSPLTTDHSVKPDTFTLG